MQSSVTLAESDRNTYPAMLPLEILVWRAWLRLHQVEYDRFDYNTRIGPGYDPGATVPDYVRSQALAVTRKRIDAVAWQGSQPTVIEVKDRAGLSSVGQLMGYIVHWNLEHSDGPRPKALLVANRLAPGVAEVLNAHSLPYHLVAR